MYFDKQRRRKCMAHWGWYWHIKLKHNPKKLCSHFICIDSFQMLRNKRLVAMCVNQIAYEISAYELKATLLADRYNVEYVGGSYDIVIEKQPCNYGGFRYFLRCPKCKQRMRKLYCDKGFFCCRKCLNIGYYTQRLRPSARCVYMAMRIGKTLRNRLGSIDSKPPWMRRKAFEILRDRYWEYREIKYTEATRKELLEWYPSKRDQIEMLI